MKPKEHPTVGLLWDWEAPRVEWRQVEREALLGRGHYATVHSATLCLPGGERVPVALKQLIPKPIVGKCVPLEEARVLGALAGVKGVPKLYGLTDTPPHALVMSRCPGVTMSVLRKRGEVRMCLVAVGKLCSILSHMHARGVTHGDLHGSNILVSVPDGDGKDSMSVCLVDFGNSKTNAGTELLKKDAHQLLKLLKNILRTMKEESDSNIFQRREEVTEILDADLTLAQIFSLVGCILRR
ncbi:hypothetical protein E2C01_086336 [Portunus trituberculatus]|uniref:Protein kinase domain-containing protein n=1 Tax=Portunus trituberculatus TaxID=210409 RepID=A0A5B7J909_PORTR|nr:hypothetical protein [Portunus trituberculatus]